MVSVSNRYFVDFQHGISVFTNFSCGIAVLSLPSFPQMSPSYKAKSSEEAILLAEFVNRINLRYRIECRSLKKEKKNLCRGVCVFLVYDKNSLNNKHKTSSLINVIMSKTSNYLIYSSCNPFLYHYICKCYVQGGGGGER